MVGESLLTRTGGEPWQVHGARIGVGVIAGAVVALIKYAGTDAEVGQRLSELNLEKLWPFFQGMIGYSAFPVFLGGIGGWISDER